MSTKLLWRLTIYTLQNKLENCQKIFIQVILDLQRQHPAVDMLQNMSENPWTAGYRGTLFIIRQGAVNIMQCDVNKFTKSCNNTLL